MAWGSEFESKWKNGKSLVSIRGSLSLLSGPIHWAVRSPGPVAKDSALLPCQDGLWTNGNPSSHHLPLSHGAEKIPNALLLTLCDAHALLLVWLTSSSVSFLFSFRVFKLLFSSESCFHHLCLCLAFLYLCHAVLLWCVLVCSWLLNAFAVFVRWFQNLSSWCWICRSPLSSQFNIFFLVLSLGGTQLIWIFRVLQKKPLDYLNHVLAVFLTMPAWGEAIASLLLSGVKSLL